MSLRKTSYRLYFWIILIAIIISCFYLFSLYNAQVNYNEIIKSSKIEISNIQNELDNIHYNNKLISNKIQTLQSRNKYKPNNPTYDQAYAFILNDKTDENTYNYTTYNCIHFSKEVNNNAEKQNISCAYVRLNLQGKDPHALIAFNTTDKGIIFFEPQTDELVELEVDKDYWADCVASSSPQELNPDNKVVNFILYW